MEDHGLWKVIVPVEHRYGTDEAIELEIWFNSEEGEFAVSEWSDCMKKYSVMSMSDVFKKLGITAEDCQNAFEDVYQVEVVKPHSIGVTEAAENLAKYADKPLLAQLQEPRRYDE